MDCSDTHYLLELIRHLSQIQFLNLIVSNLLLGWRRVVKPQYSPYKSSYFCFGAIKRGHFIDILTLWGALCAYWLRLNVRPSAGGNMAHSHPRKQSLLQKALQEKKVLQHQVLMYQRLMEIMRDESSFEAILKALIQLITKGLGYDRAGIFLADRENNLVELMLGIDRFGHFEGGSKAYQYPLSPVQGTNWISDMVNGYTKAFFANNLSRVPVKKAQAKNAPPAVICNAVVPIIVSNNEIIGVIAVDNLFTSRRLKKSDLKALIDFATEAGLAIESFRLHEKIRSMSFKDGLTGAYNRRHFENYFPREVQRCGRYKRPLGLIYVDLDHFKNINDHFGHSTGDLVLKQVAERMMNVLRNADTVVRIGGDEFAVILPEVDPDGVRYVGMRLFQAITRTPMPLEQMGHPDKIIGVSMGVACLTEASTDHHALIRSADQSLYEAKKAGRNRVGSLVTGADGANG
jgi:diguanylate cyclase (GGDEF)-like protein